MAYVNGTTHYNLPQTVGTDKRDWADTNEAFATIDAALYSATEDVADAQTEINGLKDRMTTAEGNITTNTNDISALDGRLTTAEGTITQHTAQIADVRQDSEDMICAYNEATATSTHAYAVGDYFIYNDVLYRAIQTIAIGDTIVPDTNCSTTNVSTELIQARTKTAASIASDNIRTIGNMLNTLLSSMTVEAGKEYKMIVDDGTSINILAPTLIDYANSIMSFSYFNMTDTALDAIYYYLSPNSSAAYRCQIESGSTTFSDITSSVPAGIVLKIASSDIYL